MCTAAVYKTRDFYFGRTLDYDVSFGEKALITPRNYPLYFREKGILYKHYAMIGMACAAEDYPLYYEAVNEKGLCMAGLNFVGNAVLKEKEQGKDNIAQFEFIPWVLSQCSNVREAQNLVEKVNMWNVSFSEQLPVAQLHWMIADCEKSLVVEFVRDGLNVYENPTGVLTNNPPFDKQMSALNHYMHLSAKPIESSFAPGLELEPYSQGMGAIGLPGDLSSPSRFVRAAFVKMNSRSGDGEKESVSQFFHILNSVDQQRGCCELEDGGYEITIYTCCCNASKGIYYYTSYDNHQITALDMHRENLDGKELVWYPLVKGEQIRWQN